MYSMLRKSGGKDGTSPEGLPLANMRDYHDDPNIDDDVIDGQYYREPPGKSPISWRSMIMHLALICLYTIAFLTATYVTRRSIERQVDKSHLIESPLHDAIQMERRTIYASVDSENPFKGEPSEELDHAWHQLFINSNVRVTADDLAKINRTSVPISDEKGGYYAIPDVYHQLHCLKFIRQVIWQNYYHIGKPTTPIHIEHCIDSLRQNIMCKADVALLTFTWDPTDRAPKPDFNVEHECANWDRIDTWAKEHRFDIFDETTLVHPTLGPSFPEKEYKATGQIPGHPDFHANKYHGGHHTG
ncbi:hypothetical protein BDV25DRAFT_172657 [Aspergillus avenaceus]|uniref:Tat pathway signal sequence n=1 Tax=Aspergillus avenaceus TaxID=36643 RepID=A0A5N6TUK7_ASPAV|nr:hypothetical protein BDV25DRAFT_172657 [Aspergillus avenaceus]